MTFRFFLCHRAEYQSDSHAFRIHAVPAFKAFKLDNLLANAYNKWTADVVEWQTPGT